MHRLLTFIAVALVVAPLYGQTQPVRRAIADLPTCDANTDGVEVIALDPTGASDCSTGGGTASPHPCVCDGGATTWTAISGGVSDHGGLTGLLDDDHAQYALLAGRSGGQTLNGGTAASENLTLQSTTHATKGKILFGVSSAYNGANDRLGVGTANPGTKVDINRPGTAPTSFFSPGSGLLRLADEGTNTEAIFATASSTAAQAPIIFFARAGGTLSSPSAVPGGARVGQFVARSWDGFGAQNAASFFFLVDDTVASGSVPTGIVFEAGSSTGSRAERLRISSNGNVVVNETGTTADFRIEGDGNPNLLRTVGASDNIALFGSGSFGSGVGVVSLANAATRPSTAPTDGVILSSEDAAAGAANLFAYNEAGQRVRLTGVDARVTADFNVTTTITPANVPGLSLPAEAGKTYHLRAYLMFTADATGGVRVSVTGTATATAVLWNADIASDSFPNDFRGTISVLGGTVSHAGPTSGLVTITGTVTVNAAGTLTIQFGQSAATGTSTVKRGSTFHIREIS